MISAIRDETGLPREVYALLAQANLLRMRGCWEEAVSNCMAALRLAPDNPSAQSLLGDIYENQGRFDDAIQWYRMALDANPDSPADRLKLDRLLQRQLPSARSERKEVTTPDGLGAGPKAPSKAPDGVETTPNPVGRRLMQDPETVLRYAALAAAALFCLAFLLAYAAVHRRAALVSLGFAPYQEVKTAPVVVASAAGPPTVPRAVSASRDAAEQAVLDSLRGSSDLTRQGIVVDEVQFDPRTGGASITISLSSGTSLTQAAVLRSALHTVQAATAAIPSATTFTLRCLTSQAAGADSLIFVGDVSQSALSGLGTTEPDDGHVPALFTNPWWSQQMPN